ncbi:MAG: hypothetical protein RLZZ157_973 [Pseudomonadota bacterium]|jgi:hypothetical protein
MQKPATKTRLPLQLLAFSALCLTPSLSQAMELAWVGARAGSNGYGGEVAVRILPTLVVRGIAQGGSLSHDENISGVDYSGNLDLGSFGAQIDFRPPLIPFYATAGIYSNSNQIDLTATPSGSVIIGNTTYKGSDIGTLTAKAEYEDVAYFGGLGLKLGLGPVEAALEAGVYYQGEPNIAYAASGPLATNAAFQADLAREKTKIADELDNTKYWPMVTLHARWTF